MSESKSDSITGRMPTLFISHGGGPSFFLPDTGMFKGIGKGSRCAKWLESLGTSLPRPKAILVISAHWEERSLKVYRRETNSMLFDYYGFPAETYELKFPAAGHVGVADRVKELLEASGRSVGTETARGLDHGSFVPLLVAYPEADVPVLQLSLLSSLDPAEHYAIGEALAPLRDEGVIIIGSGMTTHNMRSMGSGGKPPSDQKAFVDWAHETFTGASLTPEKRKEAALGLHKAPGFRAAHPREEHFVPSLVALGAAKGKAGKRSYHEWVMGSACVDSYQWDD